MNRSKKQFRVPSLFLLVFASGFLLCGGIAGAQTPTPVLAQLFPSTIRAGSTGFTLTILGSGFVPGSVVQWGAVSRVTNYVNSGDLEATILESDLADPGTVQVTVVNPGPLVSNALTFTISTANPIPVLDGLSPSSARAGGPAFDMTVYGQNFTTHSVVLWEGEDRPTRILDAQTLVAEISAADIASVGIAVVTVKEDAPGGGTSNPKVFSIREFANFYFPQVAVGGGYNTVFTLVNTGAETDTGTLVLTDTQGAPLVVAGAAGSNPPTTGSTFPLVIPAGGVLIITATSPDGSGSSPRTGWARVDSAKGLLGGVASFQTLQGTLVSSIAGVLATQPIDSGTIPVDNDASRGRRAGFAVANPNSFDIHVRIVVLDEAGNKIGNPLVPTELSPLRPGRQVARFLDEYLPQLGTFKGSMVLMSEGTGSEFVSIALSITRGLTSLGNMSVIPVLPGFTPLIR